MEVRISNNQVTIEGYVNAVERNSKPLWSRIGKFIERITKGAFTKALERNDDVQILLNHDDSRVLGSQKQGNLELYEDSIGLHAKAVIRDDQVVRDAREGNLVGWSFGFYDTPDGVERAVENGMPVRIVHDLDLKEVSILNREKSPAYEGTLIMARDDETAMYYGGISDDQVTVREEQEQPKEEPKQDDPVAIDYSHFEQLISDMKGE